MACGVRQYARATSNSPAPRYNAAVKDDARLRYPVLLISTSPAESLLVSSRDELSGLIDDWLWGQCTIVDASGHRVIVHEPSVWLELDEREGVWIPCGFCFERTSLPPRFPPRCDVCVAENLCWSCRERRAVDWTEPLTPLPRCYECRDAPFDFIANPQVPASEDRGPRPLVFLAWGLVVGAVAVFVVRACGR